MQNGGNTKFFTLWIDSILSILCIWTDLIEDQNMNEINIEFKLN